MIPCSRSTRRTLLAHDLYADIGYRRAICHLHYRKPLRVS